MLNAAKNTANKNSKKKKKDATSTIQGCEPPDCTVKGIQSSPKHNPKTVATTNVTVSGQPPTPPARSSSTMCTEAYSTLRNETKRYFTKWYFGKRLHKRQCA